MEAFRSRAPQLGEKKTTPRLFQVQSLTQAVPRPARRVRVKYSNKTKVLLCYVLAFGLALALPIAALVWVYPYTLVGAAPGLVENLLEAVPALRPWLGAAAAAAAARGLSGGALGEALAARDLHWRVFVGSSFALAWLLSLGLQLLWRGCYRRPLMAARSARRAVRSFRLALLGIFALNALGGALVYFLGVRFISEKTLWDWVLCEGGFVMSVAAAWICFRLAAPPAISGKHGFFRRL